MPSIKVANVCKVRFQGSSRVGVRGSFLLRLGVM